MYCQTDSVLKITFKTSVVLNKQIQPHYNLDPPKEERNRVLMRAFTSNQVGKLAEDHYRQAPTPIQTQCFHLCYKNTPAVLHAGAWLPEDNSLSTGTLVLELRPWWLQSIVNRFSFFPKLLLCQTIMDSDKFPAVVSLCLGKKGEHNNSLGLKPGLQHEMQFHKRLYIDGPFW